MSDIQARFQTATEEVKGLPKAPDNQTKLKLYALYKQGSEGDVTGDKPGMFDFIAGAKYEAWEALKGLTRDEAAQRYIDLVDTLKAQG